MYGFRLQREEEAAYASSHGAQSHSQSTAPQPHPAHASLGPFSKFEEKKTNEKTRKVTTVKKFFSPSSRTASKKGMTVVKLELFPVCYAFWCLLSSSQLQHIKPQLSFYISVCLWINKQTRYNIISDFEVTFPIAPSAGNSFHLNPVNINIYWMDWHTIWYRYPLCLA